MVYLRWQSLKIVRTEMLSSTKRFYCQWRKCTENVLIITFPRRSRDVVVPPLVCHSVCVCWVGEGWNCMWLYWPLTCTVLIEVRCTCTVTVHVHKAGGTTRICTCMWVLYAQLVELCVVGSLLVMHPRCYIRYLETINMHFNQLCFATDTVVCLLKVHVGCRQ